MSLRSGTTVDIKRIGSEERGIKIRVEDCGEGVLTRDIIVPYRSPDETLVG